MRVLPRYAGLVLAPALSVLLTGSSCTTGPADMPEASRTYRMGFSGFPPRNDHAAAVASISMWASRADAAIFHVEPPWKLLLSGGSAAQHVAREYAGLADFYRSKGLTVFVTFDFTDGLGREREARELRELGRSIAEPAVQAAVRLYIREWVAAIRPEYVGLGAETNLVRLAAPRPVYNALRTLANAAAADVHAVLPTAVLYATVQADVAWGRLQKTNVWVGIEEDLRDFAFLQALGVSAYPYLAGFADPEAIPEDYLSRLTDGRKLPLFVAEGGWSSASVSGASSSPQLQAAYVRRMSRLLDRANAIAWLQLNFTDMDITSFQVPPGYEQMLSLFTRLGFVDSNLRPKQALAVWDSVFGRRRGP